MPKRQMIRQIGTANGGLTKRSSRRSAMVEYSDEDVGNIVLLEHVNVQVPDQAVAMMFYIMGMGFTRDPYLNIGLGNMWANVGEQQFHLPTRPAQVIQGHIGVVVPDLGTLKDRLTSVEQGLAGTKFRWSRIWRYGSGTSLRGVFSPTGTGCGHCAIL